MMLPLTRYNDEAMQRYFILLLFVASAAAMSSATYRLPEDKPVAQVSLPDGWKTERHEEFIDATIPGGGHLLVLPPEGRKIEESLLEAMRYIRRHGTVKVDAHSEKQETSNIEEKAVRIFSWDATDQRTPIKIRCHVVSENRSVRLVIAHWGTAEAEKKYQKEIQKILESVT